MKQFKKTLLAAVLLIVMVFGCVMTTQAATTMADPVMKPVSTSSFTVTWQAVPDADSYQLVYAVNKSTTVKKIDIDAPTTSYTFTKVPKDTFYTLAVVAFDEYGTAIANSSTSSPTIGVATPSKLTTAKAGGWTNKTVQLWLTKNPFPNTMTGVEYQILSTSGKVVKNGVMTPGPLTVKGLSAQKIYKYRVRTQVKIPSGKTYTSAWTTKWLIPQPTMNKLKVASNQRIKVSWKKVKGATKYILYGSTSATSGYKKIKTLSGSKNSFIVSKVKGKKIQKYKNYYFKVVACKGSAKSDNSNYVGGYIYTTFK